MKKFPLIPLFVLSLAVLPLAGCDDSPGESSLPPSPEAVSESNETPTTVTTEEAAASDAATEEQAEGADIIVSDAHAYATSPSATTGAVFATLTNTSQKSDFLLSAKTDVAGTVEIHQTYDDPQTGVTLMRKTVGVDIAANGETKLEPRGFHIMLLGLNNPLNGGETFNVTLNFRHAGEVVVPVTVVTVGREELQGDPTVEPEGGHDAHHGMMSTPDISADGHDHE